MTHLPTVALAAVPSVTPAQMLDIDRIAVDEFGICLPQMMELAGAGLAQTARHVLASLEGRPVAILIGPGNNGAGGLVAARHLAARGADVQVVLAVPVARLRPVARERVATLIAMRVPTCVAAWDLLDDELEELLGRSQLIVDALLGYSASGPARGPVATLVERVLASRKPVLSLDLPTGVDPADGRTSGPALHATATMSVALPKRGLLSRSGRARAGDLYLADIGLPAALYGRAGLTFADPFRDGALVRLD